MTHRLPTYRAYGISSLSRRFETLLQKASGVLDRGDAETVHDVRVASRRFHAAALVFASCIDPRLISECERRVRRIRKSAGSVRDGDVLARFAGTLLKRNCPNRCRPGLERILLRLSQKREKKMHAVLESVRSFDNSGVAASMKKEFLSNAVRHPIRRYPPLRRVAVNEISLQLKKLLRYEQYAMQPSAAAEHHAMRIAAKRLRYTLEIFNPAFRGRFTQYIRILRSMQDSLGSMHDCDVWIGTIPLFLQKERKKTEKYFGTSFRFGTVERGINYLDEVVRFQRTVEYHSFLRTWKSAIRRGVWDTLLIISTD